MTEPDPRDEGRGEAIACWREEVVLFVCTGLTLTKINTKVGGERVIEITFFDH
jgi:hypothetical protein